MPKGNSKPQVYQGKTYPSITALAKALNISALYLGQGIKKYPDDIEKAIEHCRSKMIGTENTRNKNNNSLDHVERNVIIANTAKIIVDEIHSSLQKNKIDDHAKIYGITYTTDIKKITNQEKFLLYVAKVAVNELLHINKELDDHYLASIFVDTIPWDNSMSWSCIIAHKDRWNLQNDKEHIHEKDFNTTQKIWDGSDCIKRDSRRVNNAKKKDDDNNNEEFVPSELASNNVSCKHRDDDNKFTIICEKHDKISDFFAENMAQRQLKAEEDKKLK